VVSPWSTYYSANNLPFIGGSYGKFRIKKFKLSFKPVLTYQNGGGEILFATIDNTPELYTRGMTFNVPGGGARTAGGHNVVMSDIFGTTNSFWGPAGTDSSYIIKQWTGGKVFQKQPYLPHVQSLYPTHGWKRNNPPKGGSVSTQLYFDTVASEDQLLTNAGAIMVWGSLNDPTLPPSDNYFRKVGDLYLDSVFEFCDLGNWNNVADLTSLPPTKDLMGRIESLEGKMKDFDIKDEKKEEKVEVSGVKMTADQFKRFHEMKSKTPSVHEEDYVSDQEEPGLRTYGTGLVPSGDVFYVGRKSNSNKSTKSTNSKD